MKITRRASKTMLTELRTKWKKSEEQWLRKRRRLKSFRKDRLCKSHRRRRDTIHLNKEEELQMSSKAKVT
jgi:hypothetical protein